MGIIPKNVVKATHDADAAAGGVWCSKNIVYNINKLQYMIIAARFLYTCSIENGERRQHDRETRPNIDGRKGSPGTSLRGATVMSIPYFPKTSLDRYEYLKKSGTRDVALYIEKGHRLSVNFHEKRTFKPKNNRNAEKFHDVLLITQQRTSL